MRVLVHKLVKQVMMVAPLCSFIASENIAHVFCIIVLSLFLMEFPSPIYAQIGKTTFPPSKSPTRVPTTSIPTMATNSPTTMRPTHAPTIRFTCNDTNTALVTIECVYSASIMSTEFAIKNLFINITSSSIIDSICKITKYNENIVINSEEKFIYYTLNLCTLCDEETLSLKFTAELETDIAGIDSTILSVTDITFIQTAIVTYGDAEAEGTTTTIDNDEQDEIDTSKPSSVILGVIIGSSICYAVILIFLCIFWKYKQKKSEKDRYTSNMNDLVNSTPVGETDTATHPENINEGEDVKKQESVTSGYGAVINGEFDQGTLGKDSGDEMYANQDHKSDETRGKDYTSDGEDDIAEMYVNPLSLKSDNGTNRIGSIDEVIHVESVTADTQGIRSVDTDYGDV